MTREMILVLDFGGQYNQLIARRVRENNVYCEVHTAPSIEKIRALNPVGIILTGGPQSVYEENSLLPPAEIFNMNIPVLGICYGAQAMAKILGGEVKPARVSEYGKTELEILSASKLFKGVEKKSRRVISAGLICFLAIQLKRLCLTRSCSSDFLASFQRSVVPTR